MKLAQKLALALFLAICVVLVSNGYLEVRREIALFESDTRRDHHLMGQGLSVTIAEVWRVEGESRAIDLLGRVNETESDGVAIRWVWTDSPPGDPFHSELVPESLRALERGEEVAVVHQSRGDARRIATYIPVAVESTRRGAIELVESLDEEQKYVRTTVLRLIATAALMALVSGAMALVLGIAFVGKPIRRLVDHARRVGEGQLHRRLSLRQRDEVGELARELDLMCERLEEAHQRIATETRVKIATIEQLRHADRLMTVGKLASGIAHELGTPLNVISARARMVADGDLPSAEVRKNGRIVADQAERITRIVRQLLDFARRRTPKKEPHDLRKIADQTVTLLQPLAQKQQVTFVVEGAELRTEVDPSQLEQALANLVVNGIQAMPRGGTLAIRVRAERARPPADVGGPHGDFLVLEVEDQGNGIPPEHRPRLFEPFFTTKEVGHGTGLGLSVAYGIVREHGGWIDVESEVGGGSRFRVYVPASGA